MSPEDAYNLIKAIAEINGMTDKLKKWPKSEDDKKNEKEVQKAIQRGKPLDFEELDIRPGEMVELWHHNKPVASCEVVDNKHVKYEGEIQSLTSVVKTKLGIKSPAGPDYFKFNGRWLNDIRREKGLINF
ncbi:MAG: hypothetical protein IKS54_07550 [Erysipelotrichaceae bacterium]|nr:hypothetical protein [Erysipelotrichaceae bacterium]